AGAGGEGGRGRPVAGVVRRLARAHRTEVTPPALTPGPRGGRLRGRPMPTVAVIIPAAGKSSRFGGREKKPFVSLDGRPVWQRSAELFWTRDDVTKVYLVISPDDREEFRRRFTHLIAFANAELVDGGAERFDSVANGLAKVPESVEFVAVHDAVRPLTPPALVDAVFAAAMTTGAAMLAVPVADTLKRVEPTSNRITET